MLLLIQLYVAYSASRLLAGGSRATADLNAAAIRRVETILGLNIEAGLNAALLHVPWLEIAASYWYAGAHYLVTLVVLVAFWVHRPQHYTRSRNVLVLATWLALVFYFLLPTTPPRLMAGYVDTLSTTASMGWWGNGGSTPEGLDGLINELAAMPSMHVGWAFWSAICLWSLMGAHRARLLVWLYPLITTLVVVATANHWVLDAVVGVVLVLAADAVLRVPFRRPSWWPSAASSTEGDAGARPAAGSAPSRTS